MSTFLHYLDAGRAPCDKVEGSPSEWPYGNSWTDDWDYVTCKGCLKNNPGPKSTIHYLHAGVSPCPLIGVPSQWPKGNSWSADWVDVTCLGCLKHDPRSASPLTPELIAGARDSITADGSLTDDLKVTLQQIVAAVASAYQEIRDLRAERKLHPGAEIEIRLPGLPNEYGKSSDELLAHLKHHVPSHTRCKGPVIRVDVGTRQELRCSCGTGWEYYDDGVRVAGQIWKDGKHLGSVDDMRVAKMDEPKPLHMDLSGVLYDPMPGSEERWSVYNTVIGWDFRAEGPTKAVALAKLIAMWKQRHNIPLDPSEDDERRDPMNMAPGAHSHTIPGSGEAPPCPYEGMTYVPLRAIEIRQLEAFRSILSGDNPLEVYLDPQDLGSNIWLEWHGRLGTDPIPMDNKKNGFIDSVAKVLKRMGLTRG